MFFKQYDLDCLSLFSYMIGDESTGRAVVVDPQRDVDGYIADAAAAGLTIECVIETHMHADFLSGHLELQAATGARIAYGASAQAEFPIDRLEDGATLSLGEVQLEFRATPGHTPDAICIVVREHAGSEPWAVLTGDTLFIGDVGRPDLLTSNGWTAEALARELWRSLDGKVLTLPDATRVYPAHGAGSACGKNLSTAAWSTIGEEKRTNPALQVADERDFVRNVTDGQGAAPLYFAFAARRNAAKRDLMETSEPTRLDVAAVVAAQADGAVVIDTRGPDAFAAGHLKGSLNVGLDGRFAEYAGDVVRPDERVILTGDDGRFAEARTRLGRIGFDAVVGCLADIDAVLAARPELRATADRLSADDAAHVVSDPEIQVVDVRGVAEAAGAGTIDGALNHPLGSLLTTMETLDPARPTVVYCAGGYRSSIAASSLRRAGFADVRDITGGFSAWQAAQAVATR